MPTCKTCISIIIITRFCDAGWILRISVSTSQTWFCVVWLTRRTWASTRPGRRKWCVAPGLVMTTLYKTVPVAVSTTKPPSCRTHRYVTLRRVCVGVFVYWRVCCSVFVVCVWCDESRGRGFDLLTAAGQKSSIQRWKRRKSGHRLWHSKSMYWPITKIKNYN